MNGTGAAIIVPLRPAWFWNLTKPRSRLVAAVLSTIPALTPKPSLVSGSPSRVREPGEWRSGTAPVTVAGTTLVLAVAVWNCTLRNIRALVWGFACHVTSIAKPKSPPLISCLLFHVEPMSICGLLISPYVFTPFCTCSFCLVYQLTCGRHSKILIVAEFNCLRELRPFNNALKHLFAWQRRVGEWELELTISSRFEMVKSLRSINVFPWLLKLG